MFVQRALIGPAPGGGGDSKDSGYSKDSGWGRGGGGKDPGWVREMAGLVEVEASFFTEDDFHQNKASADDRTVGGLPTP